MTPGELKQACPCPWCGLSNLRFSDVALAEKLPLYRIECWECGADGPAAQESARAAIIKWNARKAVAP